MSNAVSPQLPTDPTECRAQARAIMATLSAYAELADDAATRGNTANERRLTNRMNELEDAHVALIDQARRLERAAVRV